MNKDNEQIFPNDIPRCENIEFTPLLPDYKKMLNIQWGIFFLVLLTGGIICYFLIDELGVIVMAVAFALWLTWLLAKLVLIRVSFPKKGYAIREHDIHYQTGYFIRKETSIPIKRIQHLEIRQGMISKMLKMARLVVFTAGESAADLSIKGISLETAENIKALLTHKMSQND